MQARHARSADAHEAAATRYAIAFGGQWRDLLEDTYEAFKDRGYQAHRLVPAGYRLPVVNGGLVFVWRVPAAADVESGFATSKTRMGGFFARRPVEMFGPSFVEGSEETRNASEQAELERMILAAGEFMPVVLVMVHSTPRSLNAIDWAVAEYVGGTVRLHGEETIWKPEFVATSAADEVESFDSGSPVAPSLELQTQDRTPDA
ncbi:hypothetical protein ACI7YT_10195 [Microbacterium sp. M]|uniref:hypothetical protein n=1 Tax=Microbacterium sp. M TaxID=3377125 RepID=UPI0038639D2D